MFVVFIQFLENLVYSYHPVYKITTRFLLKIMPILQQHYCKSISNTFYLFSHFQHLVFSMFLVLEIITSKLITSIP